MNRNDKKMKDITILDFKSLKIVLANKDDILSWSRGEVTKPETINYRTLRSEKDGLFDEKIFGPTKDWECYCGKYKRVRFKGIVCDKCGVEVTQSRVRRERMGHLNLAAPVAHVWFFKGAPSKISLLLDVAPRAIEQVVYFARYLVVSSDEVKRKEAFLTLEKAKDERFKEVKAQFEEKYSLLKAELEIQKEKIKERIKGLEQASLAVSEIVLKAKEKEATLNEEEKSTIAKTEDLFGKLVSLAKNLKAGSFLSEEEHDELSNHYASDFLDVKMGAEAILAAVEKINLDELSISLKEKIEKVGDKNARYVKFTKRLKLIDGMRKTATRPEWMILRVLPVLPPDLRPMVQLSGGRFATSDLNDLYRRVINRNNRLKHLISLGAPEIILRNEKRMLQESVDYLIDTSIRTSQTQKQFKSLSDILRGKQGRFRKNLLGKRVDYSGRSVIIVGPELTLNQCGLPKEMALELFKPFVIREVISRGLTTPNVKAAKRFIERRSPEIFDILEEITKNHPVLLNRAPTLHKLGMQAFYPVLVEGSAIKIHPCVCSGYNADFDGDQMAIHVPLSSRTQEEI